MIDYYLKNNHIMTLKSPLFAAVDFNKSEINKKLKILIRSSSEYYLNLYTI